MTFLNSVFFSATRWQARKRFALGRQTENPCGHLNVYPSRRRFHGLGFGSPDGIGGDDVEDEDDDDIVEEDGGEDSCTARCKFKG